MPPPPSPLAHRRSKPSSFHLDTPSCGPRKMSLSKAETFHQPSSPATEDDPVFSIAHLQKRSTTYSRSSFASWLFNGRETAADAIADFEATFSGARGSRPATRRRSARDFEDSLLAKAQRISSPVDSGIGSSIGSPSEKNLSSTLEKALDLTSNKDSALGDSLSGSVAENLVQGWLRRCVYICASGVNTSLTDTNSAKASSTRSQKTSRSSLPAPLTIIRYPLPSSKKKTTTQPLLSQFGRRQIYKRLFAPLLQESRFEDFRPIIAGTRKNNNLQCLRDIEQALINQPVVSTTYPLLTKSRSNSTRKSLTVTASEYRAFGELTVQLVVDTFQHLSESEQRRSTDRAYESGYFLDLVQQVQQLAAHIGSSNTSVEDESAPSAEDEITLEGGLGESGTLAELVRWKNGEGISLRTGLPYVPMAGFKRSASGLDDVERSMARRKKGYIPEIVNMPCSHDGCDKVFQRKCDLSKHEKTHSRPYKCTDPRCKFHEFGLPTEKELDRHMNDRHNIAPKMYKCEFCEFQTKRESNCKQHMEKKHDWTYHRAKGKDKATAMTPSLTPQTPGTGYSITASPASGSNWEGSASVSGSINESPYEQSFNDFGYAQQYPNPLFPRNTAPVMPTTDFDFNAPLDLNTGVVGYDNGPYLTPNSAIAKYTPQTPAYSTITPSPMMMDDNSGNYMYYNQGLPTPDSAVMHSRQPSNAHEMPPNTNMTMNINQGMDDIMFTGNDMPQEDFQLFGIGGPFTNPSGGDATLFPAMTVATEAEYTPEMFDTIDHQLDFGDGFNDMVDYQLA